MTTKIVSETEEQKRNREIVESIAKNIGSLVRSVNSLLNGPLKKKALVVLLATSSGMSRTLVEAVLTALQTMEKDWLN